MSPLISLYLRHSLIGFALAGIFTGLLIWFDVARIGYLVAHVEGGWLAVLMLWIFNGIVFAPVQFCIALWRASEEE